MPTLPNNKKITELTQRAQLDGREIFPYAVIGGNYSADLDQIADYCVGGLAEQVGRNTEALESIGPANMAQTLSGHGPSLAREELLGKYVIYNGSVCSMADFPGGNTLGLGCVVCDVREGMLVEWVEYQAIAFGSGQVNQFFGIFDARGNYMPCAIETIDGRRWVAGLQEMGGNAYRMRMPAGAATFRFNARVRDGDWHCWRVYEEGDTEAIPWLEVEASSISGIRDEIRAAMEEDYAGDGPWRWSSLAGPLRPAEGASLRAYGDSIAYGVVSTSASAFVTDTANAWPAKLAAALGWASFYNRAVSGATANMVRQRILAEVNSTSGRLCLLIAAGVNDYLNGVPLGTYGDTSEAGTFCAGVRAICEHLASLPNVERAVFVTPIPCLKRAAAPEADLNEYRAAIYRIATEHGFEVLSGLSLGMPAEEDAWGLEMVPDRLHPSARGRGIMARSIIGKLS